MANKGILSKNYYIDPVAVSDFGADVYNVIAEADRAMEEASEIIAEIASLTERVPSEIRCGALLEACATAQAEIKSVDFLSYGQRVDQGLQNLLDHNQYISDHFIKNMRANTERMHGLEEEFRRLSDLITYSGEGVQAKGIKLFTDGNLETTNIDSEEENLPNQGNEEETELDMTGWGGMFPRAGAATVLEIDRSELENLSLDEVLANVSIEGFEQKLQLYENGNVVTYENLCGYLDLLLRKHYLTQSEYEEIKRYILNLKNTSSSEEDINRDLIFELLTNRKEIIESIENKIEEVFSNRSSDNPKAIVEYRLLNEYKDELLDGIITVEELEEVINIIERKNSVTFTNIGALYMHDPGGCDCLVMRTIEPYIFATEHVSVELLNQLDWKYVNEEHVSELRLVMVKYDITTVERLRHFLAQCDVESGISEDLLEDGHGVGSNYYPYYGAGRIQLTFKYGYCAFAIYKALERYPELEDEVTYYNPAHFSGDYIYPQYENLLEAAEEKGLDISEFTDIVNIGPKYVAENYAWESAGYFWDINECNEAVDSFTDTDPDNVDAITGIVNFYDSHYEERRNAYEKIKEYVK